MIGEQILIVDDHAMSRKLLAHLMRANGYAVTVAIDAQSALDVFRLHQPRVVLIDIQLPGMDGLEVVRLLRAERDSRRTLIIAVTSYAMQGDKDRALEAGCDQYFTKPIDTRAFPEAVTQALQRPPNS